MQILAAVEPMVIFRRRRVISGVIKQLERIPDQNRSQWIFKRERKINRVVEDLLELTM